MPAAVTPAGVRDGDPGALAGLCAARGPSVLAYCRHVAGDADAGAAAADAFAHFRKAVVATDELSELDPEALLLAATRRAAATRAARSLPEACAEIPALLGARAEKTIAIGDLERLDQHLQSCWTCRAPVARFKAAERAYCDPPDPAMDPAVVAEIIAAMTDAVPAPAPAAKPPPTPSANGHGHVAPAAPGPAPDAAASAVGAPADGVATTDEPTTEFRTIDAIEVPPPPAAPARAARASKPAAAARSRSGRAGAVLGAFGLRSERDDLTLPPRLAEPPRDEQPEAEAPRRARGAARVASGTRLARAQRPAALATAARPRRARGHGTSHRTHRLPAFLPIAVVLAALLVALFVSGVVGGSDPASSPRVDVPADAPASAPGDAEPADVVVVPGAEEASAAEVEQAKARDRERAKRRREAAASEPADTPATPPAAATAPPVVAPPPPPPPAAAVPERESGSGRRIEPGSGATGAEQIPPAKDTSTVPDLAPAPETATAP